MDDGGVRVGTGPPASITKKGQGRTDVSGGALWQNFPNQLALDERKNGKPEIKGAEPSIMLKL